MNQNWISETVKILSEADVVTTRQRVKDCAVKLLLKLIDQTKIVTAASEIARNTLKYGGGGQAVIHAIENDNRAGIKIIFEDQGPGIPDLARAFQEGYTTGRGMGLGLSGSKRLVDEFDIQTEKNKGTRVTLIKWK
jgi:serine/threonine-protein kinase RsbT